ncbi:YfcE family phosphodiesterase, partial [Vibrio breoganii]
HGPRNPVPEAYAPAQVAELLNKYKDDIISVRGNCDSEVDQMLLDFPVLSDFAIVLLESGKRLFLTHGHLYNQDRLP